MSQEQIQQLLDWLQKGGTWVADQAPDLARQLLRWKLAENVVVMIACLIVFYGIYRFVKWQWEAIEEGEPLVMLPIGLGVMNSSLFLIGLIDALKILLAPKIFLIEYLTGLLKR
jgi:hypothetical protein